jgi:hypothetical protein
MHFSYEAGEKNIIQTKVLYYHHPQLYFMLDLHMDSENITPENLADYDKMIQSVQIEPR